MYERTYHAQVLKKDTRTRRHFPWKKVIIFLSCALIIAAVIIFIRIDRFQIVRVEVKGTAVVDPMDVSQFVLEGLQGKYLWVLPRASIVLVTPRRVQEKIHAQFPRFKDVDVSRKGMSALTVDVVEYPGVYLWCDERCSFMDETGVVFAEAPYFSGSAYLKIYGGERTAFPFSPLAPASIEQVHVLDKELKVLGIDPIEVHFDAEHKATIVFMHYTHRVELYIDPTRDLEGTLTTLAAGLDAKPFATLYKDAAQVLEYVDARFANKLVYKFQ